MRATLTTILFLLGVGRPGSLPTIPGSREPKLPIASGSRCSSSDERALVPALDYAIEAERIEREGSGWGD